MIIAVSGNIGAGKTTLVKRLSAHLGFRSELEAVDRNPYLELFYQDMKRWSFPLQVYFLSHRFRQGLSLEYQGKGVVLDRTIYEDAQVFARNLLECGYMTETDFDTYLHLYDGMVELVKAPDLLIYLKASPEKLVQRISGRGSEGERSFEGNIPKQYLVQLHQRYEEWISQYQKSPLVVVDVNETDLADDSAFDKLLETVQYYRDA